MTSKPPPREAYVWIWLPGETDPVVAGRIEAEEGRYVFNYGRSYLEHDNAMPIYLPELPLRAGALLPDAGLRMASALRDAAPDAWGRRVIINKLTGLKGNAAREVELDELTFMLASGSDRTGALDFQASATHYIPRDNGTATLEDLLSLSECVEKGIPIPRDLDQAVHHGTSIGGARPKAHLRDGAIKYVAKFSSANDSYNMVKAEFVAMRLAALAGLKVAAVKLTRASDKDVLLIERFDRGKKSSGWSRKAMVSALTIFGLDEMMARYASYETLADTIRARFTDAPRTLRELFGRLTFNILVGNTDDHARNHAAFWDGEDLTLTPAYDICPQARSGREASQAMLIYQNNRESRLDVCLQAAGRYLLSEAEAVEIIKGQVAHILENWRIVCDEAELTQVDRNLLWRRQVLNNLAFEGSEDHFADFLRKLN